MGFVKTSEEISAVQLLLARPRLERAEVLSLTVTTEASWLARVLPPPLEPAGDTVRLAVGRWHGGCAGAHSGGGVYLPARFGGITGEYVLAMYMDSDASLVLGRTLFGEPKKLCRATLRRRDREVVGVLERYETPIVRLEAQLVEDLGPRVVLRRNFNVKAELAPDGQGLQYDPLLTVTEWRVLQRAESSGDGRADLASTPHDPLGTVPVGRVQRAAWAQSSMQGRCRTLASIRADDFLPYAYGRLDDYVRHAAG
ncbi:MAG: acetoacetate decarboxylase family protein [Euzebyales bacterium]|nr:acetoacetate decarboxylase family protein [Euzebyales bacterium]